MKRCLSPKLKPCIRIWNTPVKKKLKVSHESKNVDNEDNFFLERKQKHQNQQRKNTRDELIKNYLEATRPKDIILNFWSIQNAINIGQVIYEFTGEHDFVENVVCFIIISESK